MLAARIMAILLVGLLPGLVTAAPAAADRSTQIYGPFMIWNKAGTGCMVGGDLNIGTKIYAWSGCYNSDFPDQKWYLYPVGTNQDQFYIYSYLNDNRCLTATNNNINTVMTIGYCYMPSALWNYSASGGYVRLQHSVSGLCALAEQTSANSDKVVQWYCMPQYDDQWWFLTNTA